LLPEVSRKNKGLQKIIGGQPLMKFPFLKANIHYHIHDVSYAYIACLIKEMHYKSRQSSSVTGVEGPRGFQEVKVPRFLYNGTGWW
jgi:hypothetical protein